MTKLGIGIIGCGNISSAYLTLAPLFKSLDMRAVADVDITVAEKRADEFGVRASSVEDLLAADDIDIIVNLTIPDAHFAVTKSILEAGKHAYSEKPVVLDLEQGKTLAKLAQQKNLRIGSAPDTILGGAHQQVRALIDSQAVGNVIAGTCHVMSHGMESWHPNPDFFYQPGAGPVLDIGPYYIANLIQLIGPVSRVVSLATTGFAEREITSEPRRGEMVRVNTPTNIHALLHFVNGATITLSASWDVWAHRHANMELYGTQGSLFVPDPNFFGGTIEMSERDGEIKPMKQSDHPFGKPNQDKNANYRGAGLADMASAIAENRPHRCSMELALHTIDVMTGILKSGETGSFIDMATSCDRPEPLDADAARKLMN